MSSKITIIGAGSVGATIAYKLSYEDIASEIVMIDSHGHQAGNLLQKPDLHHRRRL